MKIKTLLVLLIMTILFCSCNKYDGLILTDENTGKKYLLEYNFGNSYFIKEQTLLISGSDTTYVFK